MDATAEAEHRSGQPRSEHDAAFLKRFDAWMQLPIIVSAILPLIVAPESNGWVGVVIGVVTWLVFLVDYVVHVTHLVRYRRTRLGRFDLFVVVATAPWFLLPGARAGQFVVVLRLARLARLVMATRGARRLFERLGRVAAVAGGVVVVGSLVAYHAEHPTNPGFKTVGDALWWGIVTLTTVGYGDIVPKTATGRWAAVVIMLTGVAGVLGVVGHQRADHDDPACQARDPAQPLEQAARSPGRHQQAGDASQAEQDHELARLGARDQEPGGRGDHHEQVKAAKPGAPIALKMAGVHHVVEHENQPGDHADDQADPAIGLRHDHQRQDGRHDDRQLHPGVETLKVGGVAFRAGLARPVLCLGSDTHGPDRARSAGPGR